MTRWLEDPSVRRNDDGTYTITSDFPDDPPWTLRDTGAGWEPTHPDDGFEGTLFATAEDAAGAVLGDPAKVRQYGQSRVGHAIRKALS